MADVSGIRQLPVGRGQSRSIVGHALDANRAILHALYVRLQRNSAHGNAAGWKVRGGVAKVVSMRFKGRPGVYNLQGGTSGRAEAAVDESWEGGD